LAKYEAEILLLGIWKNVEELEEYLTVEELEAMYTAIREKEYRHFKMLAAVQGIDLDENKSEENQLTVEDVKARLAAKQAGKSEEQWEVEELGFDFEDDEEEF
jgi:hypothetical protein